MHATSATESWWQVPRRLGDQKVVSGLSAGIGRELGVDPLIVRTAFVVLTIAGGWGIVLYAALWGWSWYASDADEPTQRPKGKSERHRQLALGLGTLGLLILIRSLRLGFVDSLVWPCAALGLGFVVIWLRARDDVDLSAVLQGSGPGRWLGLRIAAGIAIAAGGVTALLALNFDLSAARNVALGSVVVLAGIGLILGPWIFRTVNDLNSERHRRIRSEERTEVAAHLHDSVLQTLALIQRNADDQQAMVQLARRQERELRDWLYGGGGAASDSFRRAVVDLAAEVEELHEMPVDVVVVGDADIDVNEPMAALLGASREALVNAAKHSGASKVDLFAEVSDDQIDVFVRDTGHGFDPDDVAEDRRGLTDSVHRRMERVGGHSHVHTALGDGTEVELSLPRATERTS